jgi:Bacterial Ig-like domain
MEKSFPSPLRMHLSRPNTLSVLINFFEGETMKTKFQELIYRGIWRGLGKIHNIKATQEDIIILSNIGENRNRRARETREKFVGKPWASVMALCCLGFFCALSAFSQTAPTSGPLAPTVSFTVPAKGATAVAINGKVAVTFSEAMNRSSITKATFSLKETSRDEGEVEGEGVAGTVSYAGVTATFTPARDLEPNTAYAARVRRRARDLGGKMLASDFVWSFTTSAAPDTTPPTVSFTVAANGATGVAINQKIAATFSEPMDPVTITTATFTLEERSTPVAGMVSYTGVTATFNPLSALAPNTPYTAKMTTAA